MTESHQEKVERARKHVEGGRRMIANQKAVIAQLQAHDQDTKEEERPLNNFLRSQIAFVEDLRKLLEESER